MYKYKYTYDINKLTICSLNRWHRPISSTKQVNKSDNIQTIFILFMKCASLPFVQYILHVPCEHSSLKNFRILFFFTKSSSGVNHDITRLKTKLGLYQHIFPIVTVFRFEITYL